MATPPRTGGLSEIGELLGVSRQRAYTLAKRADFPAPVATSRAGRTWDLAEVEAWETTWDRENKGGRPKGSLSPES
jgi:predicted DNA-binding transcriptional regulator AlpA